MARGGYRPGAGRPKGTKAVKEPDSAVAPGTRAPADARKAARKLRVTPLDYMLDVVNDVGADEARRDRMAIAAAPYFDKVTHSGAAFACGIQQIFRVERFFA